MRRRPRRKKHFNEPFPFPIFEQLVRSRPPRKAAAIAKEASSTAEILGMPSLVLRTGGADQPPDVIPVQVGRSMKMSAACPRTRPITH